MWQFEVSASLQIKCQDCVTTFELHTLQHQKPAVVKCCLVKAQMTVCMELINLHLKLWQVFFKYPLLLFEQSDLYTSCIWLIVDWFLWYFSLNDISLLFSCDTGCRHVSAKKCFFLCGKKMPFSVTTCYIQSKIGHVTVWEIWCVWGFSRPVTYFLGVIHS